MTIEQCPQRKWPLVERWRYKVIRLYGWRVDFIVASVVLMALLAGCTPLW